MRATAIAILPTILLLAVLLSAGAALAAAAPAPVVPRRTGAVALQERRDPVADPRAVVRAGNARFTVLTPRMIRMEWAADGRFEDRPSFVFLNRRVPVPEYRTREGAGWLVLETEALTLRHRGSTAAAPFDSTNLEVRFTLGGTPMVWRPGTPDTANLGGTIRTLDGVKGPVPMDRGLLSRDGWTLVDDGERPLFDGSDWPWVVQRPPGARQDWYLFAYGHDYTTALRDFTLVAGRIPVPPRFAFGSWWSRYWAYTDQQLVELVGQFETFGVPLDVLVIDMDWHETFELRWREQPRDQAGQPLGWTGYTWNRTYFPEPQAFLDWTAVKGLRTPLNLHPASGVQPHEQQYEVMARAMGIDPATRRYVPFRIEAKPFALAYFEHVIRPLERTGVDFWWLDWQQWHETEIPGLTPTWWLNYVFFTEMERRGRVRPLILHRYGGLGNHRYQIGFSGDAASTWEMLAFEPQFTATASNVLYGYWSHDIGGHLPGTVTPELYTRWIQFGALSPILRTHTTKNPQAERRIWAYPPDYFQAMRDAILLRYALIPYIYTAARQAYETGVSLVRPLYYDHPEADEAYAFTGQYMFGDDILVAPVTSPLSPDARLARVRLWLPPGEWVEWFTGARLRGPAVVERAFALDEIPVYVRAGAVIPMQPQMRRAEERPVDPMILTVFPAPRDQRSGSRATRMYEDAGNDLGYRRGELAWTTVHHGWTADGTVTIEILPAEGSFPGMLTARGYEVRMPGTWPPDEVRFEGEAVAYAPDAGDATVTAAAAPGWRYDGQRLTTVITLPPRSLRDTARLTLRFPAGLDPALLDGVPGTLARMYRAMTILNRTWPDDWAPEAFIDLVQTGRRITLDPGSAPAELEALRRELPAAVERIRAMKGDPGFVERALAHFDVAASGTP